MKRCPLPPAPGTVKTKTAVTAKDGSTKLASSDYTATYASGRKNVGKYTVTAKPVAKGNYMLMKRSL